ncbi:MAG: phosphatidylglycerol lysyltransferase domain-containing protein [Candidatus Syntrophopropionicum ammoniitolerans]
MINFKEIEIADKKWIDPLLAAADMRGSQHNFTNLLAWANIFQYRVARLEEHLVVKAVSLDGAPCYLYPAGRGELKAVIEALAEDAAGRGEEFLLAGISKENMGVLDRLFPDQFVYTEDRDSSDYIYLLEKLATLAGRKYSAKRNHINHFKRNNSWSFEPVTLENLAECWAMSVEWCEINSCMFNVRLTDEYCAVRRCFENFVELGLEGGLLRVSGRVVAYTMGGKLNSDTYDIHIEKAFDDIQVTYQMINREFAALIREKHPELIYVNREEDMGQEGLRKAKRSYHPVKMEEKYWGKFAGGARG